VASSRPGITERLRYDLILAFADKKSGTITRDHLDRHAARFEYPRKLPLD